MCGFASQGGIVNLVQDNLDCSRIFLEVFFKFCTECGCDVTCNFGVAELTLCLSFELRLRYFNGNHSGKAFANIFRSNLGLFFALRHVLCEFADNAGEGCLETRHVCTAIVSIYVVDETEEVFLVAVVVPHGDFQRVLPIRQQQVNRFVEERGAVFIHVTHKFRNATGKAERICLFVFRIAFVRERQTQPAHEEG